MRVLRNLTELRDYIVEHGSKWDKHWWWMSLNSADPVSRLRYLAKLLKSLEKRGYTIDQDIVNAIICRKWGGGE